VYATDATWERLSRYDIVDRERVACRKPVEVEGLAFEAFPVAHSLLAPAVAYRISAGGRTILYAPDLVAIDDEGDALRALVLYVGDGASIVRPIVRRRDGVPIGHASIRQQIDWCRRAGLRRALFTHCGSQILRDEDGAEARVAALGREQGIDAALAHDGLVLELR
jgi:phosphoribosyl 1,2-cyclic phosphodiesterase